MTIDESHAEEHLAALAETTPDAFVTIDTDSRIQFANEAVEDVFGYEPEELIGESLTVLMPEEFRQQHFAAVDNYLTTGTRQLDWEYVELPGEHKEGHEVPLELTFSEFTLDGDRYFTGVMRDVSERETLEAERDLLHAARDQVVQADSFGAGLRNALGLLGESMNWVYGEAWVPVEDGDRIEWETAWGADATDEAMFPSRSGETALAPGQGLVGRVWESGDYEWLSDVSEGETAAFESRGDAGDGELRAALGVPILADGSVVAVLAFLMPEARSVDERMVEATRTVAANLGLLMARKRAEDALREERNLVSKVLGAAPSGIVVIDADGEFTYANERARDVLRIEGDGDLPAYEDLSLRTLDVDGDPLPESERPYRAVFRTGEEVTRDVQVEYPDGTRAWLAVHGTPLRDDAEDVSSAVFAFEDVTDRRERADRLERLNELGRALSDVETFDEACEQVAIAARDVLSLPVTSVQRYDADAGRLEPQARASGVDELAADDPLFPADSDAAWEAFAGNEARVYSDLDAEQSGDEDGTPLSSAFVLPLDGYGVFVGGATEPDAFSETTLTLARVLVKHAASTFDRLDREVALRERKSELESKNEQLRRVQRVNQQIRDITEALIDAESSAEIKQLVCDRLADIEPYRFVWFGERDLTTDEVAPVAWAGVEEGYLDAVSISTDVSETERGPAGRAIHTREAQLQNNLQANPPFDEWRQEALDRGYRACTSIPVVYRDTLYGLVTLYGNEPGAFTEMEQAVLVELGEMIGYALNAMARYNALVADDSVELEFVMRDPAESLLRFLREEEGEFRFENIGSHEGGAVRVFGVFEGISYEQVESFVGERGSVEDLTLIRERDDEAIVELTLASDSFVASLLSRGAVPTDIRAGPDEGRMTIRVSRSASVREFVEQFEDQFDWVELVARRQAPDPVKTREEFERAYLDHLTERQEEVLRTAYFSGFFEQPRESSASDVAETLDVSQPTVSRHIRSGEEKLFSMLFGDDGST